MDNHTPGPWEVRPGDPVTENLVAQVRGLRVFGRYAVSSNIADAQLVASAPQLLAERDTLRAQVSQLEAELAVYKAFEPGRQTQAENNKALRAHVKVLRKAAKSALNEIEKHYYFEVKQILQDALSATEHAE